MPKKEEEKTLNYNKLKYFYEIAKIQNLSRASELLFVSQSSLSKAIADLEKEFGTALFLRTGRRLVLTNAGKELQKQLKPFFSNEDEIYSAVRSAGMITSDTLSAKLKVGFMCCHTGMQIPAFIKYFSQTHPLVAVSGSRYNKKDILRKLGNHSLDMAFLIFSMEELNANYKYRIISEHHLSIIAREEHPLAKRDAINISELRNEYFIMHGPNTNEYDNAMNWCKMSGFYPRITGEYDYVETVLMLVQAGAGISILSDAAPIDGMKGLVSIPLENAPIVYNGVFWNPNPKTPAVEMFIEEFIRSRSNRKRLEVEDT